MGVDITGKLYCGPRYELVHKQGKVKGYSSLFDPTHTCEITNIDDDRERKRVKANLLHTPPFQNRGGGEFFLRVSQAKPEPKENQPGTKLAKIELSKTRSLPQSDTMSFDLITRDSSKAPKGKASNQTTGFTEAIIKLWKRAFKLPEPIKRSASDGNITLKGIRLEAEDEPVPGLAAIVEDCEVCPPSAQDQDIRLIAKDGSERARITRIVANGKVNSGTLLIGDNEFGAQSYAYTLNPDTLHRFRHPLATWVGREVDSRKA